MKARYLSGARLEFLQIVRHYEEGRQGLGRDFSMAIREAIATIVSHPLRWPLVTKVDRRYRLHRFPYGIVYRVRKDEVEVIAVMHMHRKPGYWKRRR